MKNRVPHKLICLTICLYASSWGGTLYPRILQRIHGVNDDTLLSAPSRFAQGNLPLMLVLQAAAAVTEIAVSRRSSLPSSYFGVIQAALLFVYFGLLTYDMFLGPISLHHGPAFSPKEFMRYGSAVYPVSLVLIAFSVILVWHENRRRRNEN